MNLISGISVSLEYFTDSIVAYVYLDDGVTMVQTEKAEDISAANAISTVMKKLTDRILEVDK